MVQICVLFHILCQVQNSISCYRICVVCFDCSFAQSSYIYVKLGIFAWWPPAMLGFRAALSPPPLSLKALNLLYNFQRNTLFRRALHTAATAPVRGLIARLFFYRNSMPPARTEGITFVPPSLGASFLGWMALRSALLQQGSRSTGRKMPGTISPGWQ